MIGRTAATASLVSLALLALGSAVAAGTAELAGGLLTNGDFFASTSPWIHSNPVAGSMDYSGVDATDQVGSGSARITNHGPVASVGDDGFQCVGGILPGETYLYGGKIHVVGNDERTGYATVNMSFFGSSNCSTSPLGGSSTVRVLATVPGQFIAVTGPPTVAPAGTMAASIQLHTLKYEAGLELQFLFDDVYLCGTDDACALYGGDFENGGTQGWSTTVW